MLSKVRSDVDWTPMSWQSFASAATSKVGGFPQFLPQPDRRTVGMRATSSQRRSTNRLTLCVSLVIEKEES